MEPIEDYEDVCCAPSVCGSAPLSLDEFVKQKDAGFTETLLDLIQKSGQKNSTIYKKANISKQHFSKIINDPDAKPSKQTAIALALALELDLDATRDLIGRAGFALTNSSTFDLIIRYFIEHKQFNVIEINIDGKTKIVASDTTKTKSSYRSLPLVKPFEEILLKMKREQEENKRLCGRCYCQDYLDYIYVNQIGEIVKPGFVTAHFSAVLKANSLPHIRFHDLRHSCASLLFAQGVSLKEIQAWLGHSTIGTTANIYTHLDENNKLSSANAIIAILPEM